MGNKNFYKGRGTRTYGRLTSKGRFVVNPDSVPRIEVLDLEGFELGPYVWRSKTEPDKKK
jgi:Mitochondrial ribosomal protein L27